MSRTALCCAVCVWMLWVGRWGLCRADVPVQVKLKPDRLTEAVALEREALAKRDSLLLAEAWYLYGKTYVLSGDYKRAQHYFLQSLRIHEPRGDSFDVSRLYLRLSENENRLGHPANALRYASQSLQIARRIRSDVALHRSYGALAHVYESLWSGRLADRADYERILDLYRKSEHLCYKLKDTVGLAELNIGLGIVYARAGDHRAISRLEKAVRQFRISNKESAQITAMVHLAGAYLMADKPYLAYQTLQKAEALYGKRQQNRYDIRLAMERNYVRYFQAVGQWQAAFNHLANLTALEKRQLMADNNGAITRLNIEYETGKKETLLNAQNRELALRMENLHTQQRSTWAMSALFVIAAVMSFVLFRLNRNNQRISRRNETLVKEQNHRVKNNLQVVASLLSLQSRQLSDETARQAVEESRLRVESMAIIHRRLYDGDKLAQVNLGEFVQELVDGVLRSYGYPAVEATFSIDRLSLPADKAIPLGLILNELTTNACKYAFPSNNDPQFSVSCHRKTGKIHLTVTDNGPGLDGPELSSPGLDKAAHPDWKEIPLEHAGPLRSGLVVSPVDTLLTKPTRSFGLVLIQAQVSQLHGTAQFTVSNQTTRSGVLFTLEFAG